MKLPLLAALCAALAAFSAAALLQPAAAQTGIASTTKYNDLPVNYVKVEKLSMDDAQFSTTNSDIKMKSNWQNAGANGGATINAIVYDSAVEWGTANTTDKANAQMAKNTVPGSFSLRWKNAAVLPDGTKADVIYTFSAWKFYLGERPGNISAGAEVYVPILQGAASVSYTTYNPRRGVAKTTAAATTIKQSIKTTVKIVKSGTNTAIDSKYDSLMVKFLDLDVIDHSIAHDKSAAKRFAGAYSEGIALVSGWKSPIYRTADTTTVMETVGGNQKIRGTKAADGTISSGFIGSAAPQGYSYIWYGSYTASGSEAGDNMATGISVGPEVSVFASAGKGGSIEKPGATNYILNARTTYDYKPAKGYKVKSLTVNGSGVSFNEKGGTYTFEKLIERSSSYDHTIDVQFKGPSVKYVWDGDHPDRKVPDGGEVTPGNYGVDDTYRKGDAVYEENVKVGDRTYPRGTWIFDGWDREGTIEVWEDTLIKGRWSFRPEWNIETEVVNGKIEGAEKNIPDGENRTVTYGPEEGYQLKELTVDGEDKDTVLNPEGYTFSGIDKDHKVRAVFELIPELEIRKRPDRRHCNAGDIITYTVMVKQKIIGAQARGVVVTDSIPEGLSLIEGSISGDGITVEEESENAYKITLGSIGSDEALGLPGEVTYTYQCKAAEGIDAHDLVNTVTAGAENVPGNVTDEAAVDAHVPEVTLEKLVDKERAGPGDTLSYTVKVRQTHEGAALRNVVFVDTLPKGITVDEASIVLTRLPGDDAPDAPEEEESAAEEKAETEPEAGTVAGPEAEMKAKDAAPEAEEKAEADAEDTKAGAEEKAATETATEEEAKAEAAADAEAEPETETEVKTKAEETATDEEGPVEESSGEGMRGAGEDAAAEAESGSDPAGSKDEGSGEGALEEAPTEAADKENGQEQADKTSVETAEKDETVSAEPEVSIEDGKIVIKSGVMKTGFDVTFEALVDEGTEGELVNLASVDGYITEDQKLPEPVEDTAVTLVAIPRKAPAKEEIKRYVPKEGPKTPEKERKASSKPVRTGDESFPLFAVIMMACAFAAGTAALTVGRRKRGR